MCVCVCVYVCVCVCVCVCVYVCACGQDVRVCALKRNSIESGKLSMFE